MIKSLHMLFILLSISSFIIRIMLAEFKPALLQAKLAKIAPHVIDTLLILTGLTLVFQGNWLSAEYGWIISKIMILLAYIGLGIGAMRNSGMKRWIYFAGALACFGYILLIAISKHGFI
ncbi:MAG: SirB2 family protein [Methyloprofundus sp.]|nr:SirB2 family protein [Methyloprofundus sp.]MDT8427104.1 SirB2 family protein [Methyloprofundus sp.]